MRNRPTIIDVAKVAGVSKSTVSLVLQNSPTVKDSTRRQVLTAIEQTGYVYNRAAAKLRGANAGLVGLVINDIRNPFYTELAASVQMTMASRGYATVIGNADKQPKLQSRLIESMIEHHVSALMISPVYDSDIKSLIAIADARIPTIQVLRKADTDAVDFPFYFMDYEHGGYIATDHLLQMGAKHIAFVGGLSDRAITIERKKGYCQRLTEAGLQAYFIHGKVDRAFGYEIAKEIAQKHSHIDGIVAFNDQVAVGLLNGFLAVGISVGERVKVVGFDDIEEASHCFPKLSSVRCNVNQFGKDTSNQLLDWVEKKTPPAQALKFPVELITRDSSGITDTATQNQEQQ